MEKLINEARKVYSDYGKAVNKAMGFRDHLISLNPLIIILRTKDKEKIKLFIHFTKILTEQLKDVE